VQNEAVHWFHCIAQLQQTSVRRENRINQLFTHLKEAQDAYNSEHSEVVKLCQKVNNQEGAYNKVVQINEFSIADTIRLRKIRANDRQMLSKMSAKIEQLEAELLQAHIENCVHPNNFGRYTEPHNQQPKVLQTHERLINLPEVQQRASPGHQGPVFSDFNDGVKDAYPMPKPFTGEDNVPYDWWKG
jgi:BMFP domain-containing protein YqiC